ncbi:hypothetical protein BHE74_00029581, partial [Ensete ventricosum]
LTGQDNVALGLAWSELSGCRGGHPCNLRVDMSRLTSRDNVATNVVLGPVWSMEGPSGAAEAVDPRPQVVGHPSSSLTMEVVNSSSGGATLTDSKVLKALMVMQSCYNSVLTMMVRRLAEVWEHFYIPVEYKLYVPLLGQCPYDASRMTSSYRLMLSRWGFSS